MSRKIQQRAPSAETCLTYLGAMVRLGHIPSVFALKLGRAWRAQALPAEYHLGPKRQCYENAGLLALGHPGLTYVEGYACGLGLPPLHHAWCVDAEGCVIDNTFTAPERSEYYGVPISADKLRELVADVKHWGLFAEFMTPQILSEALADVQAGAWPADAAAAAEVQALLQVHLAS